MTWCRRPFAPIPIWRWPWPTCRRRGPRLEAHAWGARYPQTQLGVGHRARARCRPPMRSWRLSGHPPQSFWFYDALLDVSYEVDLFGHVRRAIEAARADTDAALAARDVVKITVAAETTRAYAQVCALGEAITVTRQSIEVVTHEERITVGPARCGRRGRLRRGTGAGARRPRCAPRCRRCSGSASRRCSSSRSCWAGRRAARRRRRRTACQPPTLKALIPVGDGGVAARAPTGCAPGRAAGGRGDGAHRRRHRGSVSAHLRCSAVMAAWRSQPSQVFESAGLTWGIGPSIKWSFPNQSPVRARIHQARASEQAAIAGFDGVVLQALKETDQSLATYAAELSAPSGHPQRGPGAGPPGLRHGQ